MKRLYCTVVAMFLVYGGFCQKSYHRYHQLINSAEEAFVRNNVILCYKLYDSCFSEYQNGYAKDYYIAAQISFLMRDTSRTLRYLQLGFANGIPLEALGAAPIFRSIQLTDALGQKIVALSQKHSLKINQVLRDSVYFHLYTELVAVNNVDLGPEYYETAKATTNENVTFLLALMRNGKWPSEKRIGIYKDADFEELKTRMGLTLSTQKAKRLNSGGAAFKLGAPIATSYQLFNYATFIPLLHDPCRFTELKEELWKLVEKGEMHPKDFAMLEEWSIESVDPQITPTVCDAGRAPDRYNIIGRLALTDPKGAAIVAQNRERRWLQSYEIDQQKKLIAQKEGMQFFFGFLHYR